MKKLLIILVAMIFAVTSCNDYLDVSSPSEVDEDFVFTSPSEAQKVLMSCYEILRARTYVHSNGLFYDLVVVGSDSECHPEGYDAQTRHIPEGLYAEEISIDFADFKSAWQYCYQLANRLAIVKAQIETKASFKEAWDKKEVSEWTQLYGEAVTMRAIAYHELVRFFGDIPYFDIPIYTQDQIDGAKCTSRFVIYDALLEDLKKVEPYMYRLGEGGIGGERISRSFVQAFIGRVALYAGGYQTVRTDTDFDGYGTVSFTQIGSEKWNAKYVRRSDYKDYYETAKTYLKMCVDNPGSAYLITSDGRGAGFNNPFQRHFQYMMDLIVSPESLFEIAETQTIQTERPYAFGRPSGGGSSNAYPCKSYGQSRMYASFYYGDYDPADLRRDVSITVTANSGACSEKIVSFTPGSREKGGLVNNKWDESRMSNPYIASQRQSGVNTPYLRMADAILMLAEVYAELGEEGNAKAELTKVRSRAFSAADQNEKVTNYISALSGDALKEAIAQERKLEFVGEGLRRYDLIRTGKFPEKIKQVRDSQKAMVAGLKANGYYTFANGNTISNYIWVKMVNVADFGMSSMLTTQCTVAENDPTYPIRFPSWRGNYNGWSFTGSEGTRNIAIKGLFNYIDPNGDEAKALEADGYKKTDWGKTIVDNEAQYTTLIFKGYPDEYYAQGVPPRYLCPLSTATITESDGLIKNGYGFANPE